MDKEYIPTQEEMNQAFSLAQHNKDIEVSLRHEMYLPPIDANFIKDQILCGFLEPLRFYKWQKQISDALEALRKDDQIMDAALDEIAKHPKGKANIDGSVITSQQRSTYHYSTCNYSKYNELQRQRKELDEQIKECEAFMKALPSSGMADPESGEMIMPPTVEVKEIITVKL